MSKAAARTATAGSIFFETANTLKFIGAIFKNDGKVNLFFSSEFNRGLQQGQFHHKFAVFFTCPDRLIGEQCIAVLDILQPDSGGLGR